MTSVCFKIPSIIVPTERGIWAAASQGLQVKHAAEEGGKGIVLHCVTLEC